ncbi:MAG TPA: adenylosuccinate lyase family protein [Desulfobulbus sp.]|nr:adenylosuccinate lyase family protein [Desulfobulbus sp.]
MASHPLDFAINPHVYGTPELTALFDEQAVMQRWLDVEAALATAQGELGIIPAEAAAEIARRANIRSIDLDRVREAYGRSRNSLVPLLGGLRQACTGGWGEYVHFGATTQDILDTGEILALRRTLAILYRDLRRVEEICLDLARSHRRTPMVARTHGQQALPFTLGMKVAGWLGEIRRNVERLKRLDQTIGCGQLSGAVGTMAALGPRAMETAERTMELLGLRFDPVPWHTSRDAVAELASIFAIVTMTMARIANEIFALQKTEIGELAEPSARGALASSTMPHKRNPVLCQRVVALSRHVRALAGTISEAMLHEHERDPRSLWAEWLAIPQLCIYTGTTVDMMRRVLAGLEIRTDRMAGNLSRQKSMVTTEWLLFRLSESMGKMAALEKVHSLAALATEKKMPLAEAVLDDRDIGGLFSRDDLALLEHPERYTGLAERIVDQAVRRSEDARQAEPAELTAAGRQGSAAAALSEPDTVQS